LRHRTLRSVHRARQRRADPLLQHARRRPRRKEDRHDRRPLARRQTSAATGMDRRERAAVRLLSGRADHVGRRAAGAEKRKAHRRRHRRRDVGKSLPLWNVSAHPRGDPSRGERGMIMDANLDRRDFVKLSSVATAGILLGIPLPARSQQPLEHELAAWIQVSTDDTVTLWVSKSDMGQDVRTTLPMILAEEMDADFSKVRIRQAHLDRKFGRQGTGGSGSVRNMWTPLRKAGATARAMLAGAAAAKWSVDAAQLEVENGAVLHRA